MRFRPPAVDPRRRMLHVTAPRDRHEIADLHRIRTANLPQLVLGAPDRADLPRAVPSHLVPVHIAVVARIPWDAAADGEAVRAAVASEHARVGTPALTRTGLAKVVDGV